MNGYWRRDAVSIAEAMEMAQTLWALCDRDIREHDRYWAKGGCAKMGVSCAPGAWVSVWFSPQLHRSGVTVERRGLKEVMTYSQKSTLLDADCGWLGKYAAWRYSPSCDSRMDDLGGACAAALEEYRRRIGG